MSGYLMRLVIERATDPLFTGSLLALWLLVVGMGLAGLVLIGSSFLRGFCWPGIRRT